MTTRADAIKAELSGHYVQTVAEVHRRARLTGWDWSMAVTRSVLNHLVEAGAARREINVSRMRGRAPGCPSQKKMQTFRLIGTGEDGA